MRNRIQFVYALLAFLAAEAIQIIIVYGYQMIYLLAAGLKAGFDRASQRVNDPASIAGEIQNSMSQDILYLISAIAVLICGVVFFHWYRYETIGEERVSTGDIFTVWKVFVLILLGVGCQFFVTGIMCALRQYFTGIFSDYTEQMERLTGGNIIIVLLLMIFIAPIAEELIFRGVILHKASRAVPFWGANLLQAMLFGLYHMNVVQGIYAAFIGFILGLVCHKFKSIYASMLLHMIVNISSLPVALFPQNRITYYGMILSGSILTFTSLALVLIQDNKFRYENIN